MGRRECFDHSKTKFPLLGAHRAVKCGDCHKVPVGKKEIQFKDTSQVCEDCHKDAHDGQFAKAGKTPCADCHDSQRWVPSTFNHDTRTHFPLQGGHEGVACDKCHKQTRMVDAKPVIVYKQAPSKCSDCHGPDIGPLKKSSLLQYANPPASGRTLLTEPLNLSLSRPMDFAQRGMCRRSERRSLAKNPPRLDSGSFVYGQGYESTGSLGTNLPLNYPWPKTERRYSCFCPSAKTIIPLGVIVMMAHHNSSSGIGFTEAEA